MTTPNDTTDDSDQFGYQKHLQLDTLLSSLVQISPHPEEHLFLTVHHALEIWFKHIIFDVQRIITLLDAHDLKQANWLMRRIAKNKTGP